ncbi:MAG: hypothetical protein LYZ70_07555 [Nitrososphaerales archaeon]|nr:hypothetical protein [Nitrososphaerales archaeon]
MAEAVQRYRLCEPCLGRQGGRASDFQPVGYDECFICGGLMARVEELAESVARKAKDHQFSTFGVGLSMPPGVQEREDEVRSALKLKGRETIKTQLSKSIGAKVAEDLGKELEKLSPDLTAVVDLVSSKVDIYSKPLFFYGRYAKPQGLAQRRERCPECSGRGCEVCKMTGFDRSPSVEEKVGRVLAGATGAESTKFTWIGTEDKESAVLAPGRPFVVELKNPKKRNAPKKFVTRGRGRRVVVSRGRLLPSRPTRLPSFRFLARITARTPNKVQPADLKQLAKVFHGAEVVFERPQGRPVSKRVYRVSAKAHGTTLVIDAELDGGLPVKRFVSGELVSPSVSEVLKTDARCRKFDIRGVKETGEFGFGEISRLQKKD